MSKLAPNSPIEIAKAKIQLTRIGLEIIGNSTLQKIRFGEAPST